MYSLICNKRLSILMLFVFMFAMVIIPVQSAYADTGTFKDVEGHWAQTTIRAMANSGIISGNPDGTFNPDGRITRAQFATLLVKAYNLTGSGKVFTDTTSHWAKEYIAIAEANWIVSGYSATKFGPDDPITREQMAVMIVKAAKLSLSAGTHNFTDRSQISDWANTYVATAYANNIIKGMPDGSFVPKDNATRAQAAVVIHASLNIKPDTAAPIPSPELDYSIIDKAGTYGPETGTKTITGNVTLKAKNVILQNLVIRGDLIIAKEVGDGDVTLNNVTVKGKTYVRGGGKDSIHINGGQYSEIIIEKTATGQVRIAAVDTSGLRVTISENAKGEEIILNGDIKTVTIKADDVNITTQDKANIGEIKVESGLKGVKIQIAKDSIVKETVLNSKTDVKGEGAPEKASGSKVNESSFATPPGSITEPSTGGGGSSAVAVSAITVTGTGDATTITEDKGRLQMVADVGPSNASNKSVTWSVTETDGSATDKATISNTGLLTAVTNGTVTVKATAKDGSGVVGSAVIRISNQVTPPEKFAVTIAGDAAVTTDYTITGADNLAEVEADTELTITAVTDITVNGEEVAAEGTKKFTITEATTITINKQVAAPSATVSDLTVSGTVGVYTSNNVLTITLVNDSFQNQINETVDVQKWFTNLPAVAEEAHYNIRTQGVTSPNATTIAIDVALTPSVVLDAVMQVTIPGSYLTSGKDLTVTTNLNARYEIVAAK